MTLPNPPGAIAIDAKFPLESYHALREAGSDAALMFLPSEAVYAELHGNFPDAVQESHRARVFSVRAVLKDVEMREQAGLIQRHVRSLMGDVGRLDDRVAKLDRHFGQATEDIRQIQISTQKVTRGAEKIDSLELDQDSPPAVPPAGPDVPSRP